MDQVVKKHYERTVELYRWYAFLGNTWFWLPVSILFFLSYLPLEQVLLLEAIYFFGVVVLEVPSGYFSDQFGRRPTLMISTIALIGSYGLFFISSSFLPFAIAQLLLAVGLSFNSGTDTSLHYDVLHILGREDEFGDREAKVSKISFQAGAMGAVVGGLAGLFALRAAYLFSLLAAAGSLMIVLAMREPKGSVRAGRNIQVVIKQFRRILKRIGHPVVSYVFLFYLLMTVIAHIPYEFYQPYLSRVLKSSAVGSGTTPIVSGLHVALGMFIASWFAGKSMKLHNRVGLKGVFLLAAGIQTVLMACMAIFTSWLVVALLLLRSSSRAMSTAPMNAAVAPLFDATQRATFFSLQSLAGRLAFSITLVIFSGVGTFLPGDSMKTSLLLGTLIGLIGLLYFTVKRKVGTVGSG